jgi:YebC/PmpR family DNA-binding regulatory protein
MGRAFEYRRASKEKRWDKMSKIFPRLGKTITIAARAGGPDPDTNSALRTAIMNAKAQNMPKANIEAAIRRASGKDAENFDEINYEGKGPHGVLIFVECATDNNTRTVANIKNYISKAGGQLSPTGSLEFMFSRKAVFQFEKPATLAIDDIELDLIDSGLEDIEEHEGEFFAFERLGVNVISAILKRYPNTPVEFSEEHLADIEKLIDRIEDDEDVQAVYTNIA